MERNLYKYIWSHTAKDQIWIVFITILAMVPYYMSFDLPKQIINHPITGIGFEQAGATLPFLTIEFDMPIVGTVSLFPGIELERIPYLFALSLAFLALVIVNGLIKVYINTYKGQLGERLLRRIRYELMDRILRFPPKRFKRVKAGEVASMVKDEVEPFGGFSGEAFASPVMLAGQTLTAMLFIFVQHIGLGMVALLGALVQVLIIPKLRARLIVLGRQRQLRARELAGRVTEIVDGIDTIRGNDATNLIRADLTERLGRIFKIRYDIYQWKFFVKFLNNTIAQVTPFIFYSFGGYLAIIGKVDVGQLVAVINAYKELPGPMKALIDYDLARQDIQVKYETVLNQFDVGTLIDEDLQKVDPRTTPFTDATLNVRALTLANDGGTNTLERASIKLEHGQSVALIGTGGSGAAELAEAIGRITWPIEGCVEVGDRDILELPDAISGRRITYASPKEFFFSGTLKDNLLLGLKNAPRGGVERDKATTETSDWWWQEAELSGNPVLDLSDQWMDEAAILEHTGAATMDDAIEKVLELVGMEDDLARIAMRCPLDPVADAGFAEMLIGMRRAFAQELRDRGLEDLVLPFDPHQYNDAATIGENIFFGHPVEEGAIRRIGTHPALRKIVSSSGLDQAIYRAGRQIAETTVELFRDLPPEHPYFERMELVAADELQELSALLERTEDVALGDLSRDDRERIMWLSGNYTESWYRFGVVTEELKSLVVSVRARIRDELPADLLELIELYDPEKYIFSADIRQNIIFGKPNPRVIDAGAQLAAVGMALRASHGEVLDRIRLQGLNYEVGPGGRRLSDLQRSKLNLARALLRDSDIYVFNRPLLGVSPDVQDQIIGDALNLLRSREEPRLVIWVLANPNQARHFDRVVTFEHASVKADQALDAYLSETHGTQRGAGP